MVDDSETTRADAGRAPTAIGGSIDDLRAFCAIVDFGSISAAARAIGETKGSVSRRVARLERRLGTLLLARAPRAVTPTEEGLAFHGKAREGLALLTDAVDEAREAGSIPRGHLRVTAPVDIGIDLLPAMVSRFRATHPQVTVELILSSAALDLAAHRIDLALRATSAGLPDMAYRAMPLADFEIALYASPGYLGKRVPPGRPDDLADQDLVVPSDLAGPGGLVLQDRRGQRSAPLGTPAVRTGELASVARLVATGAGIGPLPTVVAGPMIADGRLQRVLPEWIVGQARLYGITVGGRQAPARVRAFREMVREEMRRLSGLEPTAAA